jgi:hypothetical protein
MVLMQGWWVRNGIEIQGLATVALIVVTIVYVAMTRSIAAAANAQAAIAADQLAHMRTASEAEQLATRRAQEHAERVGLEALRDRLSAMTPVVIVEVGFNHFGPQEGTSGGVVSGSEFSETTYQLGVSFRCSNHGPGPALVEIEHPEIGEVEANRGPRVVPHGGETTFVWTHRTQGAEWLAGLNEELPTPEVHSGTPLTRVVDVHTWVGYLTLKQADGSVWTNQAALSRPGVAAQERRFPQ